MANRFNIPLLGADGHFDAPEEKLPVGVFYPMTLMDVSGQFDENIREGDVESYKPIPSGFPQLDHYLGGGFTPTSLIIIGGPPGVGKPSSLSRQRATLQPPVPRHVRSWFAMNTTKCTCFIGFCVSKASSEAHRSTRAARASRLGTFEKRQSTRTLAGSRACKRY